MKFFKQQSGDTLIEVTIAITIVATILTSAIALSTRAVRLGIAARERSQAAQLLQQQAEGLRALRDTKSWSDFTGAIDPVAGGFHIERVEPSPGVYKWQIDNTPPAYSPVIDGQPTFFNITIQSSLPPGPLTADDRRDFVITATWERIGGGSDESVLYLHLANRDFVITYQEPLLSGAIATSAEQPAYSRPDLFRSKEVLYKASKGAV